MKEDPRTRTVRLLTSRAHLAGPVQANDLINCLLDKRDGEVLNTVVTPLLNLVQNLADPDSCRIDHNGGCQEHSWFAPDSTPCPHGEAQRILREVRASGLYRLEGSDG